MRKRTYVLDSYALLAYFQAEPGSDKVRDLPRQARAGEVSAVMSTINLGEVLCTQWPAGWAMMLPVKRSTICCGSRSSWPT